MSRNALLLLAALVAQECSAAPVMVPTLLPSSLSFTLSITATGIPLPTGAHLDIPHPPALPTGFPGIPRGETGEEERKKRDEGLPHLPLPTGLPGMIPRNEDFPHLPLPSGLPGSPRNEQFPHLPLPTGLPGLPKRDDQDLPHLGPLPTGLLPGIPRAAHGKDRIEPTFTATATLSASASVPPAPTGPPPPPPIAPTGWVPGGPPRSRPTGSSVGPVPSGRPSGVPSGVPVPLGHAVPGGVVVIVSGGDEAA